MKSYVINLNRRKDRLIKFWNSFPQNWPYDSPVVYSAIAGEYCRFPSWWKQGGGAWGCYKSHLNIIEQELNQNTQQNVLIFEDDAIFCIDFVEKLQELLSVVPKDADQIYLGGQHLKPPINFEKYYLASNINRTHSYIVTPKGLPNLYKHLNETSNWNNKFHIDHHYGDAHRTKKIIAYAPKTWLIGQDEDNKSDICGKPVEKRWWHTNENNTTKYKPMIDKDDLFLAVIGLHRSGSSCIAMILHKLGINMGDKLAGYESKNGGGGEAQGLANICEQAAIFPSTQFSLNKEIIQQKLSTWINERIIKAKKFNTIAGGKYPHLCAMGDILLNVLGDRLRIIHCDRPLQESIDSLKRRSKLCSGWLNVTDEQAENVQNWLWENKHKLLNKVNQKYILHINYENLLNNPEKEVQNIINFLDIKPSDIQITNAINHIKKPEKNQNE